MATPVMFARGPYKVALPYVVLADVSYVCVSIDSFRKLESDGVNVLQKYYLDKGLTKEKYDLDLANATSVVTLFSDNRPAVEVPTTYITDVPTTVDEGYARLVIGLDIGVFPAHFDLSYLLLELAETVQSVTGLTCTPTLNYAPYTGVITPEQAQAFENNRKAAIAARSTYFSKIQQLESEVARLTTINQRYEELLTQG